jgi:hypothetical protein
MAVTVTMTVAATAVKKLLSLPSTVSTVDTDTVDDALRMSIVVHNGNRPPTAVEEIDLTAGTIYYNLEDELSNWDDDFSRLLLVECPAMELTDNVAPTYLDEDTDFDIVETSDGKHIRLRTYTPVADDVMRVRYTYANEWVTVVPEDPEESSYYALTVPNEDLMPLYWLTASLLTDPAGAYYARVFAAAQTGMTAIDWSEASRIMRNLSKSYRDQYDKYISKFGDNVFILMDAKSKYPYPFTYNIGYIHHRY